MTTFPDLAAAEAALAAFVPTSRMGDNYTLERMRALLELLASPQETFRTIHVAGTSGKTSTAYFIRGVLQATGAKTGLTVSPHIRSVTERIQINGQPISDADFCRYLAEVLDTFAESTLQPTYFELLVALAYYVFRAEQVDYAVVETGLGGLLDGTNTISRPDKICVITDIGLDHTEILGDTVEAIAAQKAGIIQPGNQVVVQHQAPVIEAVIRAAAAARGATLEIVAPAAPSPFTASLPEFQRRNWQVAALAHHVIARRDHLRRLTPREVAAVLTQQPPGRMELHALGTQTLVIDGAHNAQKLTALLGSLAARGITRGAVLATLMDAPATKLDAALRVLRPFATRLIIPEFAAQQDMRRSAPPPRDMAARARQLGFVRVETAASLNEAFTKLKAAPDPYLLVTGSLYLVASLRRLMQGSFEA